MNNKDLPAHSFMGAISAHKGLTKLEYAAIHICAQLASEEWLSHEEMASRSKDLAKTLFEELEKE